MTIRFLQPWNGYQIGARATLSAGIETTLKASGIARDDYQQDGPVGGSPVLAVPGDGRIRKVTGGNGEKWLPVSGQSHFAPQMKLVLSATAPVTRHAAFVIPFGFTAFKLRMFNAHTAAVDYKYAFTTQGALGDAIYNAATWTSVTVGGSTTITIPGCTGVPPDHSLSYVDSDIIYLDPEDYGKGTIFALRSYCGVVNNTRGDFDSAKLTSLGVHGLYGAYANGDGITTPANFTGQVSHQSHPAASLILYSADAVKRIGLFGSSTNGGAGDTDNLGWPWRCQQGMNTDSKAYCFTNFGHGGSKTSANLARFQSSLGVTDLDVAVYSVFSSNDPDRATAAGLARLKGQIDIFIDLCLRYGIQPVLQTWQHTTGATGAEYTNAKAVNEYARKRMQDVGSVTFDVAKALSDESAAVGTWINIAYTTDNTHPNALCQTEVMVPLAIATFA